jgi:hypothetical protein
MSIESEPDFLPPLLEALLEITLPSFGELFPVETKQLYINPLFLVPQIPQLYALISALRS